SLAAVMGGASTEVNVGTVNVLFEAAHWDPVMVARTARRHKLSSEAGKRWERGVDPQLALPALQRAVRLLVAYGGGAADRSLLDINHVRPPERIRIPAGLAVRIGGLQGHSGDSGSELGPSDEARAYRAIGCEVTETEDGFEVTPPTWRPDLADPYDLVEEFVRLIGYHNVPSVLPSAPPRGGITADQRRRRSVSRALAESGFVEVLSYPFVSPSLHEDFGLPADDPRRVACRLANPLSDEEPELRTSLLGPLLAALRRNLGRGHRDLALYELGTVFLPEAAETGVPPALGVEQRPSDQDLAAAERFVPHQPWRAATVLLGDVETPGWHGKGRTADWSDAVAAAQVSAQACGYELTPVAAAYPPWHPGRCAELRLPGELGGVLVGHAGELHPAVCDALQLPRGVCAMEVELDLIPFPGLARPPEVSGFPPALLDVALLVDKSVPAGEVQRALARGAGDLLESARLFDVFSSEQLGAGRKSLAYKLVFRASDRTLTVEEAVAARDAAVAEAARTVGATLRGG
ncbi:MAG: phenylalanine--tRNA ligase subunit beta, partial [Micromonosporaceae bacterium]